MSKWSDTIIFVCGYRWSLITFKTLIHGAEFENLKWLSILTHPHTPEKNRTRGISFNEDRNINKDWRKDNQAHQCQANIKRPLYPTPCYFAYQTNVERVSIMNKI